MADIDDYTQKAKGKMQQASGDIKQSIGDDMGAAWDKMRGTVNEGIADAKLSAKGDEDEDDGSEEEK